MQLFRLLLVLITIGWASCFTAFAQKHKVIFDSDLGGDIDDAFALALLLSSPEIEVLGIVMADGNTEARARVATKFLKETGYEDIPLILGRQTHEGFNTQFDWAKEQQISALEISGVDFILQQLDLYPNEVTLITVGPVTNMQDLLSKDPTALARCKRVVSMFGSFYVGYDAWPVPTNEWNVRANVSASQVFVSSDSNIEYLPLDATGHVKLLQDNREKAFTADNKFAKPLAELYQLWRKETWAYPDLTLFDAVAIGYVLWPELFKGRPAHVEVVGEGYTIIQESIPANSVVVLEIDSNEFINRMLDRICN